MYCVLQEVNIENSQKAKCPKLKGKKTVNITLVDVAPFSHHVKNSEVEIFTTSLHKIEHTIEEINSNEASTKSSNEASYTNTNKTRRS